MFTSLRKFFSSDGFSRFLSIATMYSKYAIALLLLFITWEWNFAIPFLFSIVGSFLIGIAFHFIAPKLVWLAKYIVTVGELAILQWYSQAVTKSLLITSIFMLPFLLMVVSEAVKSGGKDKEPKGIFKIAGILGDKLYGAERVFRLTLGAYFSFVFGLQSLVNECVLLWSFGLIGAVEVDGKELFKKSLEICKKCARLRVVFIPENGMLADVRFIQDTTKRTRLDSASNDMDTVSASNYFEEM